MRRGRDLLLLGQFAVEGLATGLTGYHHCRNALDVISKDRELPPVLGHHARHVFVEHVLLQCGGGRGSHFSSSSSRRL